MGHRPRRRLPGPPENDSLWLEANTRYGLVALGGGLGEAPFEGLEGH